MAFIHTHAVHCSYEYGTLTRLIEFITNLTVIIELVIKVGDNMSLADKVFELCSYSDEQEWFEFKENWFEPYALGEYICKNKG